MNVRVPLRPIPGSGRRRSGPGSPEGGKLVPRPPPSCKQAASDYYAGTAAGMQAQRTDALRNLVVVSVVGLAVMTVASGGLGWYMSGRVLRPVRVITETARRTSEQHLGERLALTARGQPRR